MIKSIRFILDKFSLLSKVNQLDIEESGIDSEGDPFVKIKNDFIFYSPLPRTKDKKFYSLLSRKTRSNLPFECFGVAQDIVIRFNEGGLKYKGPKKNSIYDAKEGDTVAEMGAYMGFYSMKMSKICGVDGRVIAIEPMPNNLRFLRKNIEANQLKNVTVMPVGVSNKKDTLKFFRNHGDNQSGSALMKGENKEQLEVPVDCLDNILADAEVQVCHQMVIQLNGLEIEALEGLTKILPNNLAIAARYDREGVDTIDYITNLLNQRRYKTQVIKERYIFASKN